MRPQGRRLLTEARRPARTGPDGSLVPLAEQDRNRWDTALIDEGVALVTGALRSEPLGPYQVQAAIAAVHDEAPTAADTDWPQILALYRLLEQLDPSPVVTLNRAVALAMVEGPDAGLAVVDALGGDARISRSHHADSVRGHLLELAGDTTAARAAYRAAARRTTSLPERRHLLARAARLERTRPNAVATVDPMAFQEIPVVSLSGWSGPTADQGAFAGRLRTICHEIGFFRLVDHGVDPAFLRDYFAALRAFFALPEETKARIDKSRSPWFRGWERVGAELTDARVDHREQVDVWSELPPREPGTEPAYLRLEGPNQWLDEDVLPGFRDLVERFQREMSALADELMAALSIGLGLDPGHLRDRFGTDRMSLVKLIHYPPTPPGEAGVNGHHDTGFLTLLWQHGVGGLQVRNQHGQWIDVPADDDAVVVNLGEMLQAMTGNYFVATMHRVVAHQERYSSAYFHGPELTTALTPLPLDRRYADAVAASPHHRDAGFMAQYHELREGVRGTTSAPVATYGQQLWNYFTRSYPDLVARHHPDLHTPTG